MLSSAVDEIVATKAKASSARYNLASELVGYSLTRWSECQSLGSCGSSGGVVGLGCSDH